MKQLSPETLQDIAEKAKSWMAGIDAQNKLAGKGNRLLPGIGKVVRLARDKSKHILTGNFGMARENIK